MPINIQVLITRLAWIVIGLTFTLVALLATFRVNDPDIPHYLANARYMVQNGFDQKCVFNYSHQDCQAASTVEWLSHIITYGVFLLASWNGLVALQIFLALALFTVFWRVNQRLKVNPVATLIVLLPTAVIMSERFMLRADQFALVVGILMLGLLYVSRENNFLVSQKRKMVLLVAAILILQALWANLHGSFPLGFVIIGAFLAGDAVAIFWQWLTKTKSSRLPSARFAFLSILLGLAVLVSLLNPFGLEAFFYPFEFFFGESSFRFQTENASAFAPRDLDPLALRTFKIFSVAALTLLVLNWRRLKIVDVILLLTALYLSTHAVRHIVLFASFSAMILPRHLEHTGQQILAWLQARWPNDRLLVLGKSILLATSAGFTLWLIFGVVTNRLYPADHSSRRFGLGVSELMYPTAAAAFIEQNNLSDEMFNDYNIGTYINWRLFPARQSFVDGHTYTKSSIEEYRGIISGTKTIRQAAEEYQINYFFLSHMNPEVAGLVRQLYQDKAWVPVFFDELSVIFIANRDQNRAIIDQYAIDFEIFGDDGVIDLMSISRPENYSIGRTWRGTFFNNLGLLEQAKREFHLAVQADVKNYQAWSNLGAIYHKLGQLDQAFDAYKASLSITSRYAPTHFNLGLLQQKRGLFDAATKEYNRALRINRRYPLAHYNIGTIYEAQGNIIAARRAYAKELEVNPYYAPAHNSLSRLAGGAEQRETTNDTAADFYRQGITYGQREDHDQAIAAFQKAIALDPTMVLAHLNLGNAYSVIKKYAEAKSAYDQALALEPDLALAHYNLGIIYRYNLPDVSKAIEHWQRYLELEPGASDAKQIQAEIGNLVRQEIKKSAP